MKKTNFAGVVELLLTLLLGVTTNASGNVVTDAITGVAEQIALGGTSNLAQSGNDGCVLSLTGI